jgi:hypothetical protein
MNLQDFYNENPDRNDSQEIDFGVWWLDGNKPFPRYRVSYIVETSEVYALNLVTRDVQVLGICDPKDIRDVLSGWEKECGQPYGLQWVRDRLRFCKRCGSREDLLEEIDRCWECEDEIQREIAIANRADRRGLQY